MNEWMFSPGFRASRTLKFRLKSLRYPSARLYRSRVFVDARRKRHGWNDRIVHRYIYIYLCICIYYTRRSETQGYSWWTFGSFQEYNHRKWNGFRFAILSQLGRATPLLTAIIDIDTQMHIWPRAISVNASRHRPEENCQANRVIVSAFKVGRSFPLAQWRSVVLECARVDPGSLAAARAN